VVEVVSERLGHTNAVVTMHTSMRVIPGMDAEAANQVADLILGGGNAELGASTDADLDAGAQDECK
jgi:hypothetical protein